MTFAATPENNDEISSTSSSSDIDDEKITLPQIPQSLSSNFGKVHMESSNDAHLGDKIYQGPVTIRHTVVYSNGGTNVGVENVAFDHKSEDVEKNAAEDKPPDPPPPAEKECRVKWKEKFIVVGPAIILFLVVLVIGLIVVLILLVHQSEMKMVNKSNNTENCTGDITITEPHIHVVCRKEWGARQPIRKRALASPVPYVLICDSNTVTCFSKPECKNLTQSIQRTFIDVIQWYDIGYHFLVGGDGVVYEGRGWDVQGRLIRAIVNYDEQTLIIALIGSFEQKKPLDVQIATCQRLIQAGVQLGYIRKDYKLLAARHVYKELDTPGEALLQEIKNWTHWTDTL